MLNDHQIKKVYYSLSDVCIILRIDSFLMRYWEKEFDIITKRNSKNRRIYTRKDIEFYKLLILYIKSKHYTMKGIKEIVIPQIKKKMK